MFNNQEFIPVLIGADIGTYSIARSFNEQYGVISKILSQEVLGATNNSTIIKQTTIKDLTKEKLLEELLKFAKETKIKRKSYWLVQNGMSILLFYIKKNYLKIILFLMLIKIS